MKKRILIVFLSIILLIFVILIGIKVLDLIHFKCIYRTIFNIYCPGCGTTRMIKSILKLDFYQAFRYNPLMFISLFILIPYLIYNIILYISGKTFIKPSNKILVIIFVILFAYAIFRNIPGFEYLKPTILK